MKTPPVNQTPAVAEPSADETEKKGLGEPGAELAATREGQKALKWKHEQGRHFSTDERWVIWRSSRDRKRAAMDNL